MALPRGGVVAAIVTPQELAELSDDELVAVIVARTNLQPAAREALTIIRDEIPESTVIQRLVPVVAAQRRLLSVTVTRLAVLALAAASIVPLASGTNQVSRPTPKQIDAQTRAAVRASHATVQRLRVVGPKQRFAVRIKVADPAVYLKYRVHGVVAVVNRLTNYLRLFRARFFTVVDLSGEPVFWVVHRRATATSESWRWCMRPDLAECAENIAFNIEIDPDNAAPPCPA